MTIFKTTLGAAALSFAATAGLAADVVVGYGNWPTVRGTAAILKVIIEENLGLDVELRNGSNPIIFEAMEKGDIDVHAEVWLPNQANLHNTFVKERGTVGFNEYGVEAFQGMCIPRYTAEEHGITKIEDLTDPAKAAVFDRDGDGRGEVWVGAPGWAATNIEKIRAKSYGYDQTLELKVIDETIAYAELADAYAKKEAYAFFCFTPHHNWSIYDLVALEEPEFDAKKWTVVQPTDDPAWLEKSDAAVGWDTASLHIHFSEKLKGKNPAAAAMLESIKLTTADVTDIAYAVSYEKRDPAEFAVEWVAANEDRIISWMK